MANTIPGPRGHWFLGNLAEFRAGMLPFFERCRREYGTVVAFRLGPRRLVLVSDPNLIEDVLVTQNKRFHKHFATRLLKPVLGNGLLLSEGSQWLRQRRLIQPSFSLKFTDHFVEIVSRHTARLAEAWTQSPRRDLYRDMTQLTVQIAAHAFLGISDTKRTGELAECLEVIHADFEYRFQRSVNPPIWWPTSRNGRLREAVRALTAIIDQMIAERDRETTEQRDALSLLLRARDEQSRGMPRQLLRDEVMTLLLAGHDTTANGLTWTWGLLAQHDAVSERLRAESARGDLSLGDPDALSNSLANKVVKESMRLFPPVYLFGREAIGSVQLGDCSLRKGDSVVMSQWVVHRDENFYPNHERFDPDRWSPEFEQALPKFAYFPFGGGPRVCIGKEVAMVEATVILTTLASQFRVSLEDPSQLIPWPTVTLRPQGEVWAQVDRHVGPPMEPAAVDQ